MKSIKKLTFLLASVILIIGACIDPVDVTPTSAEGGLLEISTPGVYYVIGEDKPYTIEFKVFQGEVKTTKIDVYATFHTYKRNADGTLYWEKDPDTGDSAKVAISSNEKLLKSLDITNTTTYFESFEVTLADMAADLQVADNDFYTDLPTDETKYLIGDNWTLRFVSTTSDGEQHENYAGAVFSISTRFAGSYVASDTEYLHPTAGNFYGEWDGVTKSVLSVDAITYKLQYIAYSYGGWDVAENTLYFTVDPGTLAITVLKQYEGVDILLWGSDPVATCDAGELPGIDCANTNFAVKDDVAGADELHIAYGYIRSSGTRQFSEVLTKVVN